MAAPIERWIICVSGFMSNVGGLTGIEKLHDQLHAQCSCKTTRVVILNWTDDPAAIAERIFNRRPVGHPPVIIMIGHSYGGYTVNEIAKELNYRGLRVAYLLMLDAVWRRFRRLPSALSLLKCWTIKIPDNVNYVYAWFQKENRPSGHKLILPAEVKKHGRYQFITAKVRHAYVDDLVDVHQTALTLACPNIGS